MSDTIVTIIMIAAAVAFGAVVAFPLGVHLGMGRGADKLADEWVREGLGAPDCIDDGWPRPPAREELLS